MQQGRRSRYRAYLLRCWETNQSGSLSEQRWRFSLEDPHTGQRRNFVGMDTLVEALRSDLSDGGPVEEKCH